MDFLKIVTPALLLVAASTMLRAGASTPSTPAPAPAPKVVSAPPTAHPSVSAGGGHAASGAGARSTGSANSHAGGSGGTHAAGAGSVQSVGTGGAHPAGVRSVHSVGTGTTSGSGGTHTPMSRSAHSAGTAGTGRVAGTRTGGAGPEKLEGGTHSPVAASESRVAGAGGRTQGITHTFHGRNGEEARIAADGRVRSVSAHGITITHGATGIRRVVAERADGSRLVINRSGQGYVERPFAYRGREYARRTWSYHGAEHTSYYRRYPYRDIYLMAYAPAYYYPFAFYGWVYAPWPSPVVYNWGWLGSPWYAYYGPWFAPYDVYPSAAFWLTDFAMSAILERAYRDRQDSTAELPAHDGSAALPPGVKQMIASEVQRELTVEYADRKLVADNVEPPPELSLAPVDSAGKPRVFVVAGPVDGRDKWGQECAVTEGDVLELNAPPAAGASRASVMVLAGREGECRKGTTITIGVAELQEMQNQMRESIDAGLAELRSKPGQGGVPAPPEAALAAPVPSAFTSAAPPADVGVSAELSTEADKAARIDREVTAEATAPDQP